MDHYLTPTVAGDEVPAALPAPVLIVIGEHGVARFRLPCAGVVDIGRAGDCTIQVAAPSLSRRHARLIVGAQIAVEDLGSTNGTAVGSRTVAPGERVAVSAGVPIRFGKLLATLQSTDARAAPSSPMAHLRELVARVAASDLNVVIQGETGAGKEVLASELHRLSRRRDRPMVRVNCAALSETLFESELFGHERGAFTGAIGSKRGLLEAADGGTLLLDEVGELPLGLQAKLLRAIEQREVLRVGATAARTVDVRFLAATNHDLEAAVARGGFRDDLFYRLQGVVVTVPPLRERLDELPTLAAHLLAALCERTGRPPPALTEAALAALAAHRWPGNVRELRNHLELALTLAAGGVVGVEHLPRLREPDPVLARGVRGELSALERDRIVTVLAACGGNQSAAALRLGIPRRTLLKRLDAYRIDRPRKRRAPGP